MLYKTSHLGQLVAIVMHKEIPQSFLFQGLTVTEQESLLASTSSPVRYAKGDKIYSPGHFRQALGIVLSGEVRVYRDGEDGRRVMMNRLGPGDVFGAAALFGQVEEYVTEIEAVAPSRVQFLSQREMTAIMRQDFRVAENYIRFLSGRIRFLNRKIAGFTGGHAEGRLARYLLEHRDPDGVVRMPGSMVELAQSLNIGRSSLYRAVDTMKQAGLLLRHGRQWLAPDAQRLAAYGVPATSARER